MASEDLHLQPGLQLLARPDLIQDAICQREITIPNRLDRDPDFNLRVRAGKRF